MLYGVVLLELSKRIGRWNLNAGLDGGWIVSIVLGMLTKGSGLAMGLVLFYAS